MCLSNTNMTEGPKEVQGEKYDAMYTEAIRFQSFKNWPFDENAICSASKMAEAGFFHCPTGNEPDAVQCYVCFKELDGWEPTDEPWAEHISHSKDCLFAQLKKPQKNLTVEEIFKIECARKCNKIKRVITQHLQEGRRMKEDVLEHIQSIEESLGKTSKKKK